MREQKKGNRVSWASGANLCQVKHFRKADCPSKVGQQTCQSGAAHSYHVVSEGGSANTNLRIPPLVQWRTPPEFVLRNDWLVADGEESKEIEAQKHRETRVLEAVYPCVSAIPPNPLISSDVEGEFYDDTCTPIVPITPIEERAMDLSSSETSPSNISIDSPPKNLLQGPSTSATLSISPCRSALSQDPSNCGKSSLMVSHGLDINLAIATAAAADAILKSRESGSLIDPHLLIKFLKNPEMTQKLINEHRLSSVTETGISGSKVSVAAAPLPSSQLLIEKSDDENNKPADAGAETIRRPMINQSSSAHFKTGTESGSMPIQTLVSCLRSSSDRRIRGASHENNQPVNSRNIAATQTAEQLVAADTRMGTGSRTKHVMSSVPRTSSCDVPSKTCTMNQPISARSQIVTKPIKQSLATSPQTGSFSQSKRAASSVSLLSSASSAPDLLSKNPTNEHGKLAGIGNVAMLSPVTATGSAPKTQVLSVFTSEHNLQTNTGKLGVPKPVGVQSVAADTSFDTGFRVKRAMPLASLPISIYDLPDNKLSSEHNVDANTEKQAVSKAVVTPSIAVNTGTQTGYRTNAGTPPASLTSLVHDLPAEISISEHSHPVNSGNVVISLPAVTESVAANTGTGTGLRIKAVTAAPVSLPSIVQDLPVKKLISEHNPQVDTGNVVVPKPAVTQSIAANAGKEMGFRINTVTPPQSFQTPHPECVAVPRPLMQSLDVNPMNGIGCRPIAAPPSVPFRSSIPDVYNNKHSSGPSQLANAVAGLVAENRPLHTPRVNVVAGPMTGNQPPSLSRINAELLGAPPNFGSLLGAKPVHLMGQNHDICRFKKLIDDHGAHVVGGNAPVAGTNPTFFTPSKPELDMLRKMVSSDGFNTNFKIPLPGSGPLLVPSPSMTFGGLAPLDEKMQPQQHIPASFPASPYSAPATTFQPKDAQYHLPLVKQHNREPELFQQYKPQNYVKGSEDTQNVQVMESEQKILKPCLYINKPQGCRYGARCRFQHDHLSKPWRSGGVLQGPSGKRMRSDEELTGGI